VRVSAALSLNNLLVHESVINFVRPALSQLLMSYLTIMDDIEFDELVTALQNIVEVYQSEIAPYAV